MTQETIRLAETDSTNSWLRRHAASMTADITAVTASHQTAGRGQGDHSWHDTEGESLLVSLLVRPTRVPVAKQFLVSMAHALAVRDALQTYTPGITLKWPNDTYWKDRKLGGTLIETTLGGGGLRDMIIGTGININQQAFSIDAPNPVSLRQIIGTVTPVDQVLRRLLTAFDRWYTRLLAGDYAGITAQYHASLYRREGTHAWRDRDGAFRARIERVDDSGLLHLTDTQGDERTYTFGELTFI